MQAGPSHLECAAHGAGGTVERHRCVRSAWAKDPLGAAGLYAEEDGACRQQDVAEEVPDAAVELEGDAWMEEGDLPSTEGHLHGAPATQGQRQAGCAEALQHHTQTTPSRRHRSGPGLSPSSLGEAMPAVNVAAAVQHDLEDDGRVVEGVAVEHGANVMAKCVKWAGGPGFRSGLDVAVAHCAVAVLAQNSSCYCAMERREVAEV